MSQNSKPVPGEQILAPVDPEPRSRLKPNEFEFTHLEHLHVVELKPITDQQAEQLAKWDEVAQREILSQVVTARRSWPARGQGLNLPEQNVVVTELLRRHADAKRADFERAAAAAQPQPVVAQEKQP